MLFNRGHANVTNPAVLEQGCRISSFCKVDLEQVAVYKYLGIWLDSALTFKPHIVKLQSKVRARLGFLYRNKSCFTRPAKYLLVQMSVLPILDYGDVIYNAASNAALRTLDALYHSAIRFVTGAPYRSHHCDLHTMVGWPSLQTCRLCHWYRLIYKTLNRKSPLYLRELLTISVSSYSLRFSNLISLIVPRVFTAVEHNSFQYAAAHDWNELQSRLKLPGFISEGAFFSRLEALFHVLCFSRH